MAGSETVELWVAALGGAGALVGVAWAWVRQQRRERAAQEGLAQRQREREARRQERSRVRLDEPQDGVGAGEHYEVELLKGASGFMYGFGEGVPPRDVWPLAELLATRPPAGLARTEQTQATGQRLATCW